MTEFNATAARAYHADLPFRLILSVLAAALCLATLAFSALVALRLAWSMQAGTEREMERAAREITFAIDSELASSTNVLAVLKDSALLRAGDLEAFHRRLTDISREVGLQFVLHDVRRGEQVINTAFPSGTPNTRLTPFPIGDAERGELAAGKPITTDVFFAPLVRRLMIAVGMPILDGDRPSYVLFAFVDLHRFANILDQARLENDWIATVLDRKKTILARSSDHDRLAGKQGMSVETLDPTISVGLAKGLNSDGVPFEWAYRRSALTGWVVGVGVPQRVINGPYHTALGGLAVAGIVAVLIAIFGANRIGGPIGEAAHELGNAVLAGRHRRGTVTTDSRSQLGAKVSTVLAAATAELLQLEENSNFVLTAAEVGTWQWDLTSGKQVWSERYREIIGVSADANASRDAFLARVYPDDRPAVEKAISDCIVSSGEYDLEYRIIRADTGAQLWVRAKARIDRDETGRAVGVLGVTTDVSTRKRAEQETAERTAQLRTLVATVADGVILIDGQANVLLFNPACERLFGYLADEVIGRNVKILMPPSFARDHDRYVADYRRTGRRKIIGIGRELFGRRKDGSDFPMMLAVGEIQRDGAPLFVGIIHDLTARKVAETEREELRRRLMSAHEDERLRLAHELHDEAGQNLAAAMLDLRHLESMLCETPSASALLQRLRLQLDDMGRSLDRVARELRPMSIDDLGLAQAFADYVADWGERFQIGVEFQCLSGALDDLPPDVGTVVYRVGQEALTNIAKHARGATSVSVVFDRRDDRLHLTIEDNGCGFDAGAEALAANRRKSGGLGLAGMRERLALVHGTLEIESSADAGTTIFIRIALASTEAAWATERA